MLVKKLKKAIDVDFILLSSQESNTENPLYAETNKLTQEKHQTVVICLVNFEGENYSKA